MSTVPKEGKIIMLPTRLPGLSLEDLVVKQQQQAAA
jgi:hypothetical protein